ncbi:MAG TPA: single-stranded DNA-binding protein [Clostridiales bacterium]|nr:single-stranded DNA-binding protein [Clostridiales bacterium]
MNKVVLIGNLAADPDFTVTTNNISVCRFSIAVQRRFSQADGQNVDFIPIVVWRKVAELCRDYLSKGKKVAISGSIQVRNWLNNEGQRVYTTEVIADEVEFLTPKGQTSELEELPEVKKSAISQDGSSDMELPF